jgi:hypothetical protein
MSTLNDMVPEAVIAAFVSDPALLASTVAEVARRTKNGNLARAHGIMVGKRAGRRVISEDDRLVQHVGQLVADGKAPAEALKMTAAAAGGHSYAATLDRLRRKWRRHCDNRRDQRGDFILAPKKA